MSGCVENKLSLSTRLEGNLTRYQNWKSGLLWYLDINFRPSPKYTLIYRFNLFSTNSFDNAVYSLERGIGTVNSFSLYSGEGISNYLFVKMKFFKSLSFNLRLSFAHYFNQKSIGSGNNEIPGNVKGNFGVEVSYRFK